MAFWMPPTQSLNIAYAQKTMLPLKVVYSEKQEGSRIGLAVVWGTYLLIWNTSDRCLLSFYFAVVLTSTYFNYSQIIRQFMCQ
jgi:hypothetical protein